MDRKESATVSELINGVERFQTGEFPNQSTLFQNLSEGQSPKVLFITCSDSRIVPSLLTQSVPGDLFVIRNAGNFVPEYGSFPSGEAASIEYAVAALGVTDIVLCGHEGCGAVKALLEGAEGLPAVQEWLSHGEATRQRVQEVASGVDADELWVSAVEQNVVVQIEQLRTHPSVKKGEADGTLTIHGWVYAIGSGQVRQWSEEQQRFVRLDRMFKTSR